MQNKLLGLEVINLCNNRVGNLGFESLVKSKLFPKLRDLRLDMNKVSETKQLAYMCHLDNITKLQVRDNKFGP